MQVGVSILNSFRIATRVTTMTTTMTMQNSVFSKPWASIELRHLLLDKIALSFRQVER